MNTCIFCDIIKKTKVSDIVFENDAVLVFKDMHPSAPMHLLIVPKKHIASIDDVTENDKDLLGSMIVLAPQLAKERNVIGKYKLIFNVGKGGGQIIEHIHLHFLAWPEGLNIKADVLEEKRKEVVPV